MPTPDDDMPRELPLELELERQRLHAVMEHATNREEDLPKTFRQDLLKWTDRVLTTIGWRRREVYCPTCQRRLDTQDTWTFTYERQLPIFIYSCQRCTQQVKQTWTRLQ